ncbi:MAG: hypothetical protein ACK5VI_09885 [Opitutia bacterium]|jgi:hypothetical protein
MPLTNNNTSPVQWSGVSSLTMNNSTTRYESDAEAIDPTAIAATLQVRVDNQGTPASGDIVELWISWSPDATNFDTPEHAMPLSRLDTVAANDPGEDPAARTFRLPINGSRAFKLISRAPQSASRNIVISAIYNEQRAS